MIRFIHTADVHFGMENYGRIDPKTGIHTRLLDFERAFQFCIDTALEQKVDFFLFSGDAYKTTTPSPTQQKLFLHCLLRLYKAGIPVVIVIGNHDNPLSFGKAHSLDIFGQLPFEGFYVIEKPTTIRLLTKHGPVQIVGIPWPTRNSIAIHAQHMHKSAAQITEYISHGVSRIIAEKANELDPTIPAVLAGHITVSTGIFSGSEKRAIYGTDPLFLPSDLAIAPFDYVALGHLHRYQVINPGHYPEIVYSGSIERIDFGERKEEKGFCLVTIAEKGSCSHIFIKTPTRPFIQIEVHLPAGPTQTDELIQSIKRHDITHAIIKIVYHIPAGKKDFVDLQVVQQACESAFFVVGIVPIRTPITRERRAALKATMDMEQLLRTYFLSRPETVDRVDYFLTKTIELQQELSHEGEQERE